METTKLDRFEVEELACKITGIEYEEQDDSSTIEQYLYDKFKIDMENFTALISHLVPLIDFGKSPLTEKSYKGFSDVEKGIWILKIELPSLPAEQETKNQ